ncbi:MAG: cytochrome ubiquinol oxidase subunit I [Actinomycetota bacterium]|nr:cytochrome ubiquinol oxidase subunit I [Actinomycetota bacterium]
MLELSPLIADSASNLLAARNQMAFTLAFHIVLASLGVAFPAIMLIAEYRGRKHGDADAMLLARRWSKVVAVTFAVGAVTGTVLSFEMGLLWPEFMRRFGDAFGIAFAIEGLFFFTEAIFIAIYIYGWKRMSGWAHFWSGVPIVIAGIGGAASVIAANAWMNDPQGFELGADGTVSDVQPLEVLFNPAFGYEFAHMLFAAYMVTGFLIASVYAVGMLRGKRERYHRLGMLIPLSVAAIVTPLQLFVGDIAAREVAEDQPAKFAAMECVYESGPDQPEHVGGICTDDEVVGSISIPGLDSFLVGWSTDTEVTGLDQIPDDEEPPALTLLHLSFDAMVGIGTALLGLGAWLAFSFWRRRAPPESPWFLRAVAASGVAAIVAMWCGWIVTEVGRQPWIVTGYMRTEDAVTDAQGIWWVYGFTLALYAALGVTTVLVIRGMARRWNRVDEDDIPYGPPSSGTGASAAGSSAELS